MTVSYREVLIESSRCTLMNRMQELGVARFRKENWRMNVSKVIMGYSGDVERIIE